MKLKDIAAICKKRKHLTLYTENDQQYISDGAACYKLIGLPMVTPDELLTLFDIPEKQRGKWHVFSEYKLPLDMSDSLADEQQIEIEYPEIRVGEKFMLPLETADGVVLIDTSFLKPVSDETEYQTLWYRKSGFTRYIVVKNGFKLLAAIIPFSLKNEEFIKKLYDLADGLDNAAAAAKAAEQYDREQVQQLENMIDTMTGEVKERYSDE